jgi:hypothetical protein
MAGEGLRRGIIRGNQGGGIKTLTGISMMKVGQHGVAGGGEERR